MFRLFLSGGGTNFVPPPGEEKTVAIWIIDSNESILLPQNSLNPYDWSMLYIVRFSEDLIGHPSRRGLISQVAR